MTIGYGALVTCAINPAGDVDFFSFPGTAGEKITLSLVGLDGATQACLQLLDPGLAVVGSMCANTISEATLPSTGIYTIQVNENGNNATRTYNLGLQRIVPTSASATSIPFGITISDEINPAADTDLFVFEGQAGDNVDISLTGLDGATQACMRLRGPDAVVVASACANTITSAALPTSGTYTIEVYENGNNATRTYNLQLNCVSGPSCSIPAQPSALPPPSIPAGQAFSCGTGFTFTSFGVTSRGNIAQFESPAGVEHYLVGAARSGYQICRSSGGPWTTSWDFGQDQLGATDASGWQGGVSAVQLNGPGTFPLEITRTTADGALTITRRITANSFIMPAAAGDPGNYDVSDDGLLCSTLAECSNCTNRAIHVLTRITNNTGTAQTVRVIEMVDVDAGGTTGSDIGMTTADSASIGEVNGEGVLVQALVTAATTAIRPYGGFGSNAPGFGLPADDCDITTPGVPGGPGDYELAVRQEVTVPASTTLSGSVRVHHRRY